ncbi:RdRp [Passerine astrovirus 2]|nr:RdRp [Passerine astrovirus 2]
MKVIGSINVDRLVERKRKIKDPLTNLLEKWKQDKYDSTTWTIEACTKMFEKFFYAEPLKDIRAEYKDIWDFATSVVLKEYGYMDDAQIISPIQTEKNMESTPAFPKFMKYDSEREYIEDVGWNEYMELWNMKPEERRRPLWWTFLKNETLKKEKIQQNDIRMIMCTDPVFTRFGAAFDQHQNQMMKERSETKQAQIGWTPFYGGLDQRIRRLKRGKKNPWYLEMDWTRFDGTIPEQVFRHIKEIRWFLHDKKHQTPENRQRYDWYVENLVNKVVLLPTGEVTVVKGGNPSGQISTTTDNNMVNTFLTAFELGYMYKETHGRVPSTQEFYQKVDFLCYGDDRLCCIDEDFCIYQVKKVPELYKTIFGMWVKPENIKIQNDPAGLSFCGLKLVNIKGLWYGTPNVDKILSTIENPVRSLPDIESLWGKLVSLRILTQHADKEVNDYLERQMFRVKEFAAAESIDLPEVGANFYKDIWTGGP